MRIVEPRVIRLAQTELHHNGAQDLLDHIGAQDWESGAGSDGEELIEIAGRLCYRSFAPGLNKNVTKVREGNAAYIANILAQRHYSVLEHVNVTYAFLDVSRVFTHELVRHRLSAFSQESLRYVRLDELGAYYPAAFGESVIREIVETTRREDATAAEIEADVDAMLGRSEAVFRSVFRTAEQAQSAMANLFRLDAIPDFDLKKRITSAMRRCAPIGLTTAIIMTTNLRNWRHIIELRTGEHAEEEIRKVIGMVADDLQSLYPAAMRADG